MNLWGPNESYGPGDVVSIKRPLRRSWWQRLLGRPVRYVEQRYIFDEECQHAEDGMRTESRWWPR